MEIRLLQFGWDVLQTLIMAATGAYVWWAARQAATKKSIERVDARVTQVSRRIDRVEQTLENQPDHAEIDSLRTELAQTNRGLAELRAQLIGTTSLLNRLHEYLLQERRER